LTVVVRACLLPLTIKQFGSMARMQQLAPEMKAIQNKYKDDKQRQQQEVMKFYKENNVHPLGSCLPLVAQLPVFISLFYMLRQSLRVDICPQVQPHQIVNGVSVINKSHTVPCGAGHGAGFLFIPDLTDKATGAVLVVLIILYVGTQLASSLMMSSATMDPTQRKIMLVMPLFFVIFIINFPAGVIVYWITTNAWTMGQQYVIRRRIGPTRAPPAATAAGGATSAVPTSGRGSPQRDGKQPSTPAPAADGNGSSGGGLGGLLRGRNKAAEKEKAAAVATRSGPPPRPPRKKKKRSGRRR
jgi:YidC/Oxa1 family membrane protein insertase